MQYKTIVLQLIEDRPHLYQQLVENRSLLAALDHCSMTLKARHDELRGSFTQRMPGRNPRQTDSETLEIAVEELLALMPPEPGDPNSEPLSLDAAMAFVLGHSSRK